MAEDTNNEGEILVHEIEELELRSIFPREDTDFTPWLSEGQNLERLSSAVGMNLELIDTEVSSSTFRTDILARNVVDGSKVIIENQFGRSDHDHLGKLISYLAAHDAKSVVWIAEKFADEHRAAIDWLNDTSPEEFGFYAVVPKLMRIAGSLPGLKFDVEVRPNIVVKTARASDRQIDTSIAPLRKDFWDQLEDAVLNDEILSNCERRYGGRSGHMWFIPPVDAKYDNLRIHILLWLVMSRGSTNYFGICMRPNDNEVEPDIRDRKLDAWKNAHDRLLTNGIDLPGWSDEDVQTPADFSSEQTRAQAIEALLPILRSCIESQRAAFK